MKGLWKVPRVLLKWRLVLSAILVLFILTWFIRTDWAPIPEKSLTTAVPHRFMKTKTHIIELGKSGQRKICRIPKLVPNHPESVFWDHKQYEIRGLNKTPPCVNHRNHWTKFEIDFESSLIRLNTTLDFWRQTRCFFQSRTRISDLPRIKYRFGRTREIVTEMTDLKNEWEIISLWCYYNAILKKETINPHKKITQKICYEDTLFHIPPFNDTAKSKVTETKWSILIIGIDSLSHMAFIRHMPKSYNFLMNTLNSTLFSGYTTFDNPSWENKIPLLMGKPLKEAATQCGWNRVKILDNCPFLWKQFKALGYKISFMDEDGHKMFPFLNKSFDYDFRNQFSSLLRNPEIGTIGHPNHILGPTRYPCFGPRLSFQAELDLILRLAHRHRTPSEHERNHPYFQFLWTHQLTHDVFEYSKFGDAILESTLTRLNDLELLEKTILLVVSDHGPRYGPLRTESQQGFEEERLPLLIMRFPNLFRQRFSAMVQNLEENKDKFVTPLDVHETLRDVATIGGLVETANSVPVNFPEKEKKRGLSLFQVMEKRNCDDVPGINSIYCVCTERTKISEDNEMLKKGIHFLLRDLNERIAEEGQCGGLDIKIVSDATVRRIGDDDAGDAIYEFTLRTKPGWAVFYASVLWNQTSFTWTKLSLRKISELSWDKNCDAWT